MGSEEASGGSEFQGSECETRGSANIWIVAEVNLFAYLCCLFVCLKQEEKGMNGSEEELEWVCE